MKYVIDEDVKKQLGYIIREMRKHKLQEEKTKYLIEINPYTKENFCENNQICHYHTLTKLENDLIKEDHIYHILLKKLGLSYEVGRTEHKNNMDYIHSLSKDLLYSIEYIDDEKAKDIKKSITNVKFDNDCIADLYKQLIEVIVDLQLLVKVKEEKIELIEKFIDFYEDIYKGIALQSIGIFKINKENYDVTKYFLEAKKVYIDFGVSIGVINSYLITVYVLTNKYLEAILLCNEMEEYYIKTKNDKRLMHVYNYLSDYYLLINANKMAEDYFKKAIEIINNNQSLERFKYYLYYNWGLRCFKNFKFDEALHYFELSYELSIEQANKLIIINFIIMSSIKINQDENKIKEYCDEGEKYFSYGNDLNKTIFKYFRYKLKNTKYYRRYAHEKIIPILKNSKSKKEILLFFYEDLYK